METIEENSKYEMSVSLGTPTPQEHSRICLVGDVVNDEATVSAAHSFGLPVITSETGVDAINDVDWRTYFVLEDFDGPVFEVLHRNKQCIWGPPALRQVAKKNAGLSHNARPIFNYSMRGVVTCFTGIRKKDELTKLVNLIHSMGGCIRKDMNSKITHLIGTNSTGDKYQYAKTFRLTVVRPAWVFAAWENRKLCEFTATSDEFAKEHKLKAFEGQKICFLSFPPDEHQHMVDVLKSNGGVPTDLDDPECSHVVLPTSIGYFSETTNTTNFLPNSPPKFHSSGTKFYSSITSATNPMSPTSSSVPSNNAVEADVEMGAENVQPHARARVAIKSAQSLAAKRSKYDIEKSLKRRRLMDGIDESMEYDDGCITEMGFDIDDDDDINEELMNCSAKASNANAYNHSKGRINLNSLKAIASTPKSTRNHKQELTSKQLGGMATPNTASVVNENDDGFQNSTNLSPILPSATKTRLLGEIKIPETVEEETDHPIFSAPKARNCVLLWHGRQTAGSHPTPSPAPPNNQKRKRDSIENVSQISMDTSYTQVSSKKPKLIRAASITRFKRSLSFVAERTPLAKMLRPRRSSVGMANNNHNNTTTTSNCNANDMGHDDSIVSRESIFNGSIRQPVKETLRNVRKRITRSQSVDAATKKKKPLFGRAFPAELATPEKSDDLDSGSGRCGNDQPSHVSPLSVELECESNRSFGSIIRSQTPPLTTQSTSTYKTKQNDNNTNSNDDDTIETAQMATQSSESEINLDTNTSVPATQYTSLASLYLKASKSVQANPTITNTRSNTRKHTPSTSTTMLSPIASNAAVGKRPTTYGAYRRPNSAATATAATVAANRACDDIQSMDIGEEQSYYAKIHTVVDEHTTHAKPDAKNGRTHILKSDWFWYTIQNGYADEMDYLYGDYLDSLAHTPDTDRRDSLPISLNKRKRKRFSQRLQLEGTPLGSGKRRSSVSDLGLLSVSSSLFDYTTSPEKLESVKSHSEIETSTTDQTPSKKSMRFNHFMDFFNTESNYVGILDTIVNLFKNPLEQLAETNDALLNKSEIKSIFSNFLPIHEVHQRMLERLRSIHANWREESLIGDIILEYRDDLMKAYPPYVNYFEQMKEMLNQCDAQNPRFHAFLKINQTKPECGRQSLADLMIRPVQRLPSISLLLNDIWKHTNQANCDFGRLEEALKAIKEVMMHINEDKRKTESRVVIFDIFNDIEGCPADLVSSNRNFISKCEVTELSDNLSGRGDAMVLYLFSDNIEVCKKRSRGFNTAKSPSSTKPLKHVKLLPLNAIRFVIDITDSPRAFALLFRQDKDKLHSFSINDDEIDKVVYLKLLCKQMAENACRTDTDKALLCRTSQELDIDISDVSVSTLSKAFKLAARTRLKVGRAFSFNKTPSKLKRAVSTMMTSPFGSTNSLTPASQLAQMRLASCNNIHEVVDEEGSRSNSPSTQSEVLLAPLSVQPTRKNKTSPLGNVGRI